MCTVTFIPRQGGYFLGMNRDERTARGPAVAPALSECGEVTAIYPRDVEGGTWIGVNEFGAAFALLNWNDVAGTAGHKRLQSRGVVIPLLLCCRSPQDAQFRLRQLDLGGVLPFRLIAVWPEAKQLYEIRWNAREVTTEPYAWEACHWFSSSLSDREATAQRAAACQAAWADPDAGSLAWMRQLHSSHDGGLGFSLCVHRENVETLSYTEVVCTAERIRCNYLSGSPCGQEQGLASVSVTRSLLAPKSPPPGPSTCCQTS